MWYGSLSAALELFGPSRYQWDNGYFSLEIEGRVKSVKSIFLNKAWEEVPEKLVLYDYLGCNPAKGGFFRSGPILKGDGIVQNWLAHASFEIGTLSLAIRRMPAFFDLIIWSCEKKECEKKESYMCYLLLEIIL